MSVFDDSMWKGVNEARELIAKGEAALVLRPEIHRVTYLNGCLLAEYHYEWDSKAETITLPSDLKLPVTPGRPGGIVMFRREGDGVYEWRFEYSGNEVPSEGPFKLIGRRVVRCDSDGVLPTKNQDSSTRMLPDGTFVHDVELAVHTEVDHDNQLLHVTVHGPSPVGPTTWRFKLSQEQVAGIIGFPG